MQVLESYCNDDTDIAIIQKHTERNDACLYTRIFSHLGIEGVARPLEVGMHAGILCILDCSCFVWTMYSSYSFLQLLAIMVWLHYCGWLWRRAASISPPSSKALFSAELIRS